MLREVIKLLNALLLRLLQKLSFRTTKNVHYCDLATNDIAFTTPDRHTNLKKNSERTNHGHKLKLTTDYENCAGKGLFAPSTIEPLRITDYNKWTHSNILSI